jgi:hypothetical protein
MALRPWWWRNGRGALDEARTHVRLDRETGEKADAPEKMLPPPEPLVP